MGEVRCRERVNSGVIMFFLIATVWTHAKTDPEPFWSVLADAIIIFSPDQLIYERVWMLPRIDSEIVDPSRVHRQAKVVEIREAKWHDVRIRLLCNEFAIQRRIEWYTRHDEAWRMCRDWRQRFVRVLADLRIRRKGGARLGSIDRLKWCTPFVSMTGCRLVYLSHRRRFVKVAGHDHASWSIETGQWWNGRNWARRPVMGILSQRSTRPSATRWSRG